jgi:hypothetical protein
MATLKRILQDGPKEVVAYARYDADVSAEILIDVSTLTPAPVSLVIEKMVYSYSGGAAIEVLFDGTTDSSAWKFGFLDNSGYENGEVCFEDFGGIPDPKVSGYTGDLLVTTTGFDAGDACYLVVKARKAF